MSSPFFETEFSKKLKTYMWNGIDVDFSREAEQLELPDDAEQQLPADPLAPGEVAGPSTLYDPANWGSLKGYYPSDELINTTQIEDKVNGNNAILPRKLKSTTSVNFGSPTPTQESDMAYRASNDTLYVAVNNVVYSINQNDGSLTQVFDASSLISNELTGLAWNPDESRFWIIDYDSENTESTAIPVLSDGSQDGSVVEFTQSGPTGNQGAPLQLSYSSSRMYYTYRTNQDTYIEVDLIEGTTDPVIRSINALSGKWQIKQNVRGVSYVGDEVWALHQTSPKVEVAVMDASNDLNLQGLFSSTFKDLTSIAMTNDLENERGFCVQYLNNGDDVRLREIEFSNKTNEVMVSFVDGVNNKALDFSTTKQVADIGNPSVINPSGSENFSVSLWFKINNKSRFHFFISVNTTGSSLLGMGYNYNASSVMGMVLDSGDNQVIASGPDIQTGVFYMLTLVVNNSSGNLELYLNDSSSPDGTATLDNISSTYSDISWSIGGSTSSKNLTSGIIEEVLLFPEKALTASEIDTLYQKGA